MSQECVFYSRTHLAAAGATKLQAHTEDANTPQVAEICVCDREKSARKAGVHALGQRRADAFN